MRPLLLSSLALLIAIVLASPDDLVAKTRRPLTRSASMPSMPPPDHFNHGNVSPLVQPRETRALLDFILYLSKDTYRCFAKVQGDRRVCLEAMSLRYNLSILGKSSAQRWSASAIRRGMHHKFHDNWWATDEVRRSFSIPDPDRSTGLDILSAEKGHTPTVGLGVFLRSRAHPIGLICLSAVLKALEDATGLLEMTEQHEDHIIQEVHAFSVGILKVLSTDPAKPHALPNAEFKATLDDVQSSVEKMQSSLIHRDRLTPPPVLVNAHVLKEVVKPVHQASTTTIGKGTPPHDASDRKVTPPHPK